MGGFGNDHIWCMSGFGNGHIWCMGGFGNVHIWCMVGFGNGIFGVWGDLVVATFGVCLI